MNAFINAVDRFNQYIGLSVAHLYMICAVITTYEVVMRYFFNAPTQWVFEVVMVVCASAWALSGAYIAMRRGHIAITVVYERTKGKVRWWLDAFIYTVTIVSLSIFSYALFDPMVHAVSSLERSGTSFNSPEPAILKTLLFVGAVMYGVQSIVNLIKHLTGHGVEKHDALVEN